MPTSGYPSRMRQVLAGDNTREGRVYRMLGGQSRQKMVLTGDPFLGGLFRALGKGLGGVARLVAPSLGLQLPSTAKPFIALPQPGGPASGPVQPFDLKKYIPPRPPQIVIPTAGGGGIVSSSFHLKRRRRMNPLNPRALRRALARASAFARFARRSLHVTFGKTPRVRFRLRGRSRARK